MQKYRKFHLQNFVLEISRNKYFHQLQAHAIYLLYHRYYRLRKRDWKLLT